MVFSRRTWLTLCSLTFAQGVENATCGADGSCDPNSLLQTVHKGRHLSKGCVVGAHVTCPGSDVSCAGNQCCPPVQPNGPSIICPSAAPDFHGCTNPVKVEDCVSGDTPAPAPSPPAPQAPAPTRSLPHTAASLTMRIVNKEWSDGVVFCRGPQDALSTVYLDAALTQSVHNSAVDCSEGTGNDEYGSGVPDLTTLCMGLKKGESIDLFFGEGGNWPSGTCWFQDIASNQQHSLSMGPQYQSQVEFTITTVVSWDLTSVEGVSGGVTMNYTDGNGKKTDVVALPGKFTGSLLKIQPAPGIGFPTVLADKHVYGECNCPVFSPENPSCNTDACYTGCPGSLADNPCGQHRCRQWYAKSYETSESYCGWLYANNAETYCWAMDEWKCIDATCGYGAADQPSEDCSTVLGNPNFAANTYSCGHIKNQPAYPSGVWWTHAVGCTDKLVQGVPTPSCQEPVELSISASTICPGSTSEQRDEWHSSMRM